MRFWHSREFVTSRLRLRSHDYSAPGSYFVTLCTEHRLCLLGDVNDNIMVHSPAGVVIDCWWMSIPRKFPAVTLDAFIVMPNHLHGILTIKRRSNAVPDVRPTRLSDIVQWFKNWTSDDYGIGVRTEGWPEYPGRLWQENYYDHIIRNDADLERIRSYIGANPDQWQQDEYKPLQTNR